MGFGGPPIPLPHARLLLTLGPQSGDGVIGETQVLSPIGEITVHRYFPLCGPAPFPFL